MPTSQQIKSPILAIGHTQPKYDEYFKGRTEIWAAPCYFESQRFMMFSCFDTWEYDDRCYDGLRLRANIFGRDAVEKAATRPDLHYESAFCINRIRAEHMCKTLRRIDRRNSTYNLQNNKPISFCEHVARFAFALGAKQLCFPQALTESDLVPVGESIDRLDALCRDLAIATKICGGTFTS